MKLVQIWTSQVALFVDWADRGNRFHVPPDKARHSPPITTVHGIASPLRPCCVPPSCRKPARCGVYTSPRAYTGHLAATANTTHPLPLPLYMHPSTSPPLPYPLTKHLDEYFLLFFSFSNSSLEPGQEIGGHNTAVVPSCAHRPPHCNRQLNTLHPLSLPLCMHPSSSPPLPYTKHLDEYFCFPFFPISS